MISQILPHLLHATKAELARRMDQEFDPPIAIPVVNSGTEGASPLVPETIHMTVPGRVPLSRLVEAVKEACSIHGAEVKVLHEREGEINLSDRALIDVCLPDGSMLRTIAVSYEAQGNNVSFISVT